MAKSYYAVLGLSRHATQDEIKSAYHALVKEYHPDRFSGRREIFFEIQEAYSVLGDPAKRHEYDGSTRSGAVARGSWSTLAGRHPEAEPLIPDPAPASIPGIDSVRPGRAAASTFDDLFDWLWSNFSSLGRPGSQRSGDFTLEIPLTREQAVRGGNIRTELPVRGICPVCRGRGGVGPYECARCLGEGEIRGMYPIAVSIPAGLRENRAVMFPLDRYGMHGQHLTVLFRLRG